MYDRIPADSLRIDGDAGLIDLLRAWEPEGEDLTMRHRQGRGNASGRTGAARPWWLGPKACSGSRAEHERAALHAGRGGILRIGAFATATISLVRAALREFKRDGPDVEVTAVEGRSGTLMRQLTERDLDLAVVSELRPVFRRPGVSRRRLSRGRVARRSTTAIPWREPGPSSCAICATRSGSRTRPRTAPPCSLARGHGRASSPGRSSGSRSAAAGPGIALVPSSATHAVPAGLVLCRLGPPAPERTHCTARGPGAGGVEAADLRHVASDRTVLTGNWRLRRQGTAKAVVRRRGLRWSLLILCDPVGGAELRSWRA
ncbi:LysR substrate-binding domain-containing protein [Streptomyces sp. NBC_00887]|uniref:LysR substrate-binding domain-containing protein n=2 Tax=Streptomyces sp. NBC_00887 TaxID=2975859 RepID=UPI00386634ED